LNGQWLSLLFFTLVDGKEKRIRAVTRAFTFSCLSQGVTQKSHQQNLCVVFVFGQDERYDWLEDCLSGVPVVRRDTLWGELSLHHCRFGLSDFCSEIN
tara:strand:+ start:75 stop:368 length:294 start_codon:yes stop_codon:yes gene_type:complete